MSMICSQCRIGRLHDIQAPYIKAFQGQMLVFSNVPAGRCDVCDEVEYDMAFMTRLLCLLDPEYMAEAADIVQRHTPPVQPGLALFVRGFCRRIRRLGDFWLRDFSYFARRKILHICEICGKKKHPE